MKTARSISLSALALAGLAGSSMAQITPIGPFSGPFSEGFNLQVASGFPPCVVDRVFNNTASLCTYSAPGVPANGAHITGGWGFNCSIGANLTPRLFGSASGFAEYEFDAPITNFGGYFGTNGNSNVAAGATITFFDENGATIGVQNMTFPVCGEWRWSGWSSTVPVKRISIFGNGYGGAFVMMDDMEFERGNITLGACCLPDGSCLLNTSSGCTAQGGIYRGDNSPCATANCPQPATGACCLVAGCQILTQAQCTAQSGNYRGDNVTCATANCPSPCADVTAAIGGPATGWPAVHGVQTGRLFRDGVPDTCLVSAPGGSPFAGSFAYDHYTFMNNTAASVCVQVDFNTACAGTNFIYAGAYIGGYDRTNPTLNNVASTGSSPNPTASMSFNVPANTAFEIVVAEVTPGGGCPQYNFVVSGLENCGTSTPCYANCDGSTVEPILNVSDFICFQTKYAANDPYANCDGSTVEPVLNVSDFICYQTAYAAGCS